MSDGDRPQGPGLKWRKRRHAADVPYWFASKQATDKGYPVKSVNLATLADRPAELVARCERLETEMKHWLGEVKRVKPGYDGTFDSLLTIYETDSESTYHALKPGVQRSYRCYFPALRSQIGNLRLDDCDGTDLKRWFREWRVGKGGKDRLPRARFVLAVLKAAISFGGMRRLKGVGDFKAAIEDIEFPAVQPRVHAPTAKQIIAARAAAHAAGAPLRALVYSLQFETTLRQWDIIGMWLPLWAPQASTIHSRRTKWIGPTWGAIDANGIMKVTPTKTEDSTAVEVVFDLSVCPMVQEDLARIPPDQRTGPLIIDARTGEPYRYQDFHAGWRDDFKAAGIPAEVWARDIRAGGVTAGRKAGASKDDLRKLAGHAREETTDIYDRDMIEAHRRVMAARNKQ